MVLPLQRHDVIKKLAKKMIDNRNNYKKILKEIEVESKELLGMSSSALYQIALHFNQNKSF